MKYNKNLNKQDLYILNQCKLGIMEITEKNIQINSGIHYQTIKNSLYKLIKLGYIDSNFKFIKSYEIGDTSILIGKSRIPYNEVLDILKMHEEEFILNLHQ